MPWLPQKTIRACTLFTMALGLLSCGTKKDADSLPCASADAVVAEANFDSQWTQVFQNRCGTCHGSGTDTNTLEGPDLRDKNSFYNKLVNIKPSAYPNWDVLALNSSCQPYDFISKNNANESLVLAVLDPNLSLCRTKDHRQAPQNICISEGSLANLKTWIDQGALR